MFHRGQKSIKICQENRKRLKIQYNPRCFHPNLMMYFSFIIISSKENATPPVEKWPKLGGNFCSITARFILQRFSASWEKNSETRFGFPRQHFTRSFWLLRFTMWFGDTNNDFPTTSPYSWIYIKFHGQKNMILVIPIKDLVDYELIFVYEMNFEQRLGFSSRFAYSDTFFLHLNLLDFPLASCLVQIDFPMRLDWLWHKARSAIQIPFTKVKIWIIDLWLLSFSLLLGNAYWSLCKRN